MNSLLVVPWPALMGGLLIGLAVLLLLYGLGRMAGISGIVGNLAKPASGWRWAFVFGLLLSPWLYSWVAPLPEVRVTDNPWLLISAGLLVGFGSRYGSGCTSGHGVCGIARGSRRSVLATLVFIGAGMLTLWLLHQLGGGAR